MHFALGRGVIPSGNQDQYDLRVRYPVTSADGSDVPVDVYWPRVSKQKDGLGNATSWLLLKQLCQSNMAKRILNEDFL